MIKSKNIVHKDNSLLLKPSEHLKDLVNQFNKSSQLDGINFDDPKNIVSSKYYDIDELQNLKLTNNSNSFSLFYINACSLSKNFDDLEHVLSCTNKIFDIIAITETRITENVSITNNLSIKNYSIKFTPTESSACGTLLYIVNHLSYKPCQDLNIYKKNELESTFIEIMNLKKSNIVGTIYKHPSMDLTDFNSNYLHNLLEKISKELKSVFLLGDFNINLLNCNVHNPTNEFLDSLASNSFLFYILQPIRITSHSKTLINNIFTNITLPDSRSGNLTATISDHLPQFLIVPNIFSNPPSNKSNIYERDWSNFEQDYFDYFSIHWNEMLKIEKQNINYSTEMFLNKINELLGNFAPFKKISKYKLKFKSKPWITPGLQKSISVKNKFLTPSKIGYYY